jgi:transcriptional regulator with XRE-family HTH domain
MSAVRILSETEDTVTVRREDWFELLAALEDAEDRAAVTERRAKERSLGKDFIRRNYLAAAEAARLLDGENPVKVWREKRGLSQRALAAEAKIASSYLAEIETGRKPGSSGAVRKLAVALQVPLEEIDPNQNRIRRLDRGPVTLCLTSVSAPVPTGGRGAWADRMPQPTLRDALDFVRDEWRSLRSRSPSIIDDTGLVIYTTEELFREMDG